VTISGADIFNDRVSEGATERGGGRERGLSGSQRRGGTRGRNKRPDFRPFRLPSSPHSLSSAGFPPTIPLRPPSSSADWEEQSSSAALAGRLRARATQEEEGIGGLDLIYVGSIVWVVARNFLCMYRMGNTAVLVDSRARDS